MTAPIRQEFALERAGMKLAGSIEGDGPELLFLHGLNGSAASQRANAPGGYRVAAYDQRGHGSSTPTTDPRAFAIEEFVADAIAVLDHLSWRRPVVCGASMGAAVALRLALDHPGRVRVLVLATPAFSDAPNSEIARFDAIADGIERSGLAGLVSAMKKSWTERGAPPDATALFDTWLVHDGATLAVAERVVGRWAPFPDIAAVADLRCPVVLAAIAGDPMHPMALAERIAALAGAPIARFDDVYQVVAHPEVVGAALKPLLDAALDSDGADDRSEGA